MRSPSHRSWSTTTQRGPAPARCSKRRRHRRRAGSPPTHPPPLRSRAAARCTARTPRPSPLTLGKGPASWHNRAELSAPLTAVILAAGHGTRMRSRIPKVLHPLCGRPMVDWVLLAVEGAGAKDVKVIANPHHAEVAAHLDGRAELVYQRDPKGTAHAVQQVPAGELRGRQVLVVNGDSPLLTAAGIQKIIDAHRDSGAPATIASV